MVFCAVPVDVGDLDRVAEHAPVTGSMNSSTVPGCTPAAEASRIVVGLTMVASVVLLTSPGDSSLDADPQPVAPHARVQCLDVDSGVRWRATATGRV